MRAAILSAPGTPLELAEVDDPVPLEGQVLVRVRACGVCRTDLHIADGELAEPKLPLVLGHQAVGEVVAVGAAAGRFATGDVVGVPWLGWACGECRYCRSERENLCPHASFTGYTLDGGYGELLAADERFCLPLEADAGAETAPLLCAGLIGYRALRMCGDAGRVGLYGFGASAHLVCQAAVHEGRRVFAITREAEDSPKAARARALGAEWAGPADALPEALDAAIIFAPAGELVPVALRAVEPGGSVVCAGIHMSDIPSFPYADLWGERQLRSVANLTRRDGAELMALAAGGAVRAEVSVYDLADANRALDDLRAGAVAGAAVLEL